MDRYQRPGNTFTLSILGGLFTLLVGLSFERNGSIIGYAALTAGLVTMVSVLLLRIIPKWHSLWGSVLVATSLGYWLALFAAYGERWGLIWGLTGPVYILVGGVLGLLSRPALEKNTVRTT